MFRSRTKKVNGAGAGAGARKRTVVDEDADAAVSNGVAADQDKRADNAEDAPAVVGDRNDENESDDEALLARMRSRNAKRNKVTSASTVRTTSSSNSSSSQQHAAESSSHAAKGGGTLSFDDAQPAGERSSRKRSKIRPNLLASSEALGAVTADSASDNTTSSTSSYSLEMLAALRKEQNVLPASAAGVDTEKAADAAPSAEDVTMAELDGATIVTNEPSSAGAQAEAEEGSGDDDFIPLNAKVLKSRKDRSRVTFGVESNAPPLSKTHRVDEPVDNSGDDDDDDDASERQQWEDELMRRGGFSSRRSAATGATSSSASTTAALPTYPTRKRVPTASLDDVLAKLQRSFDAATFENDRASRELARLDAEQQLLAESTTAHVAQLKTASDEFEYFQVVEDYVKGLSFCLREKVKELDTIERDVTARCVAMIRSRCDADLQRAQDIATALVAANAIAAAAEAPGLQIFHALDNRAFAGLFDGDDSSSVRALTETLQRGFVDETPTIELDAASRIDVFADAVDDMNTLAHVCRRFHEWRTMFPAVYASCYCDLALETFYAPYVRAELLVWDPLSVATGSSWTLESFAWFRVLRQHASASTDDGSSAADPAVVQVRDVVLSKARAAVAAYFDPFSSLHTRSVSLVVEQVGKHAGYTVACAPALERLAAAVVAQFVAAAKRVPLIAFSDDQQSQNGDAKKTASDATVLAFASFELSRFTALLDNVLTFFVALPRASGDAAADAIQTAGFRGVMQVLHQLLAYLRHCAHTHKTLLVPQAAQTAAQLTTSPYLQQFLASSSSHEHELQRVLALLAPFCTSS